MFQPPVAPVAGSPALSALVAALPLITVFTLLGVFRVKAHWAGLSALAMALAVAVLGYGMPSTMAGLSASQGVAFGLFPIMWIVLTAIWLYQLTVASGRFEDLRSAFGLISGDPRIQAIVIAFCFGALLEALAGFGAPVAITAMMLVALGFTPLRTATTVLLANTAPVAFGAVATPIITAGQLTGIPYEQIGAMVGRQTPLLALVVPVLLVLVVDGRRGVRETWPAAFVTGAIFAVTQFLCSNYLSSQLTDIIAALASVVAILVLLRFWRPDGGRSARERVLEPEQATPRPAEGPGAATANLQRDDAVSDTKLTPARTFLALFPYLLVIAVFSVIKLWKPLDKALQGTALKIGWPGLHGHLLAASGKPASTTTFTLDWLSSPGTVLLVCGIVVAIVYRLSPGTAIREFGRTVVQLRWAGLTVASVLALAYVMNQSGQTLTIGSWIGATGGAFVALSPVLGWLGVAVTGSDTSANALFATLQQAAATKAGVSPTSLVAANTAGGVLGKMISPQNLTIAATSVGLLGRESDIFRSVIKWSAGLLLGLCLLVYLQSTVLTWMLP